METTSRSKMLMKKIAKLSDCARLASPICKAFERRSRLSTSSDCGSEESRQIELEPLLASGLLLGRDGDRHRTHIVYMQSDYTAPTSFDHVTTVRERFRAKQIGIISYEEIIADAEQQGNLSSAEIFKEIRRKVNLPPKETGNSFLVGIYVGISAEGGNLPSNNSESITVTLRIARRPASSDPINHCWREALFWSLNRPIDPDARMITLANEILASVLTREKSWNLIEKGFFEWLDVEWKKSEIGEDISEEALEKSIIKLVRQFEKAFNYNVTLQ